MSLPATLPHQVSSHTLRIPISIFHAFAFGTTSFRLAHRKRQNMLWWDDVWAAVGLFLDVLFLISFWLRSDTAGFLPANEKVKYIVLNWFTQILATSILWCARISIMVTINRLVMPWKSLSKITRIMPFFFIVLYIIVVAEKIWVCSRSSNWHTSMNVQCFLADPVPATELSFDIVADSILFVIPLAVLTKAKIIAASTRSRLTFVFASSMFTLGASIIYNTFVFGARHWGLPYMVTVSWHMEVAVSLIVSNFSVLLPIIYRNFTSSNDSETDGQSTEIFITTWVTQPGTDTSLSDSSTTTTTTDRGNLSVFKHSSESSEEGDGKQKRRETMDTGSRKSKRLGDVSPVLN